MEVGRDDVANSQRPREPSRSNHGCRCVKSACCCGVGAPVCFDATGHAPCRRRGRWLPGINNGITTAKAAAAAAHRVDVLHHALAAPPQPIAALAGTLGIAWQKGTGILLESEQLGLPPFVYVMTQYPPNPVTQDFPENALFPLVRGLTFKSDAGGWKAQPLLENDFSC